VAHEQAERKWLVRINITNVFVDDQEKALRFYTEVLGFEKKVEIPLGEEHKWLTVVSSGDPDGTELLLEPDVHPAVRPFKAALVEDGIPYASFAVSNVQEEYERLRKHGVDFSQPPTDLGPVVTAVLDDTCGNLVQITEVKAS
jgi:catechol 2,3-dioxygenase-like lactoylglutathione lyase family enzyme